MIIANLFKNRSTTLLVIMCLYVFFLPFRNNISSVLGIILFLFFFIDKQVSVREKVEKILSNPIALLSIALYLIHLIGLIYTSNFKYAGLDLEIKLPLLILPLLIFSEKPLHNEQKQKIFKLFTIGNFAAILWCLIAASIKYYQTKSITEFFYNEVSKFMHPSYFSMYLGFNVLILIQKLREYLDSQEKNFKSIILLTIVSSLLLAFIVILASKAGILILSVILTILTIKDIFKRKYFLLCYFALMVVVGLIFILSNHNATTTKRFKDAKNELTATEIKRPDEKVGSSDTRIEVWKASGQLLKKNYIIGVGTGDVKDELQKQYKKNNFILGVSNNYNCHNQFIQFFLILGIVGLIIFCALLLLTLKEGYNTKNIIMLQFLLLLILNMMLESMLESKAGVEFFAFFLPLLVQSKLTHKN